MGNVIRYIQEYPKAERAEMATSSSKEDEKTSSHFEDSSISSDEKWSDISDDVMTELSFRIIFVPEENLDPLEKDEFISEVKAAVKNCGLSHISIHYSQVKKTEDEDYPEIEELKFEIKGNMFEPVENKVLLYENFCLKYFNNYLCGDYSLPPSYIELYSNDSFINSNYAYHKLSYQNISFGVLPHNGTFYQFEKLIGSGYYKNMITFYHDTRNVVIEFEEFEINFSYQNIRKIFVNIERYPLQIYFDLFNPPIIYRTEIRNGRKDKYRNLNLELPEDVCEFSHPPELKTDVLGRANVLRVSFHDSEDVQKVLARIHYQCSEKSVYYSCITVTQKLKPSDPFIRATMDFGCTYLITAILRRNFVFLLQASNIKKCLKRLYDLSQVNANALEKALTAVLLAVNSGKILNFWNALVSQYIYYLSNKDEINFKDYVLPSNCSMIRSITLTPTKQLLWPEEVMVSNRVLRHFDAKYAIRVSFREDNMSKFSLNALNADIGVMDSCIKKRLSKGIRIGSRTYKFLAWSNSQIRDHGFWMYARDENGQTATDIREWMGDFSHINSVPKYMARMGQCFSQTEDTLSVPLEPHLIRTEYDIERGFDLANWKPYCFSDGIGRISVKLASKVRKVLGHDKLCSAFQIRYGGYKGVLVEDPTLKDVEIVFRKSMRKFACPSSTSLEIAKTSSPVPLYLNRNIITLLNGLGVPDTTFLQLQEDMLKKLTDMLYEESEATKFLHSKTPIDLYKFEDLSKSGIHLTTEPFFKSLLLALHRHHIGKIKSKARIAIDTDKGRNMFGVLDETNSLTQGEVFVQYSRDISVRETTKDTVIHQGEVLVTKNPCMHPGDVRKLRAVDVPSLHHIVDCIVFSQRGRRPQPNMMGGSDLDGDQYFVLWDPRLIFDRRNVKPAVFSSRNCSNYDPINVSDMINFFQEYIIEDQLGSIANAHLAHSDKYGIFSKKSETVADKFSIAVDFPKNGIFEYLERDEKPKEFPDFMEKVGRPMYKSDKALGKMYRVCRDFETENQVTSVSYENIKVDPDLEYSGWEHYRDNALIARNRYNAILRSVLRYYGIQHEAEAFSGAFTDLHCLHQERKDLNETEKVIIGCVKKLYKHMYEEFIVEFSRSGNADAIENAMLQKASAWYIVTYSDPEAKFLSFPWIVSKQLVNIKIKRTLGNPLHFPPLIINLDKKLQEYLNKDLLSGLVLSNISNNYKILCDPFVLNVAFIILDLWACEQDIIEKPGNSYGKLYEKVFMKLFLHVSENLGYITRQNIHVKDTKKHYSAGQLCLEFLKFCSTFRLYDRNKMKQILPFNVCEYDQLAKCAIVSYHKFALTGDILNFDTAINEKLIVMSPEYINSDLFPDSPISTIFLKQAQEVLIKYSKVSELFLREILQTGKVCVSATGSERALKRLKCILRKEDVILRELFRTGKMPKSQVYKPFSYSPY